MFQATKAAPSRKVDSKQAQHNKGKRAESADIWPIPQVVNQRRKDRCRQNLELFLRLYFPATSGLSPFSDDHRRVIARMQEVILTGGREAKAIYRGFAKTTLAENAAIWAALYGHRRFVALFGATAELAGANIDSIKRELETNDELYGDFPEICHAIRRLEGKPQRCASQTCNGLPTFLEWTAEKIALPFIEGSAAAGCVVTTHGITSASRGLKHKLPDGTGQRPDLVIIDDPQTDESALSPSGVNKRLGIIKRTILRLAGHQKAIACIVNGTVIEKNDVMDQLTDEKRNPSFQSERVKMIRKWSDAHESFWLGEYAKARTTYDKDVIGDQARAHRAATSLYRRKRAEADAGCVVSWRHCYDSDRELSAIQHAYNILIDDGADVFASECQGEPVSRDPDEGQKPSVKNLASRISNSPRGVLPVWTSKLVAFVDVQQRGLWYAVAAFADDFTSMIVDYGTEPEQARRYYTLADLAPTLEDSMRAAGKAGGLEAYLWHGLDAITSRILGKSWRREDGTELRVDRLIADSGWGDSTATVYEFCRRSPFSASLWPSKGIGIRAGDRDLHERPENKKPGNHLAFNTVLTSDPTRRAVRLLMYDTNFFKTFIAHRLATLAAGSLTIFGRDPGEHRLIGDHFGVEFCERTFGRGREIWEWRARPGLDNHFFDCVVGCFAGAAQLGCRLEQNRRAQSERKRGGIPDHMIAGRAI